MKNLLLRVLSVIIIAVSAPMSANASSAAITKYSAFAKQHDKMPSEKIMAAAAKLENAGNEDKAIVLYTLVCNRFNKDLPEKEKQTCILAHVKAGILYMNRAEYSKAFDTEVEGVKLSEMCKEKNMQKELEQLYKDTTAELEEKSSLIRKLQAELQEHDKTETKSAATDDAAAKYHTSNLNEEGQKIIARKIVSVMEGTTEYCRTDFTLDRLAELVGSNSKYVSQVINDSFKKNFNAFINTYRIQLARERLIDVENYGNLTIKGIAESVGFKSPTTFINVFKKMVGLTPSMYQNMAKNEMKETEEQ